MNNKPGSYAMAGAAVFLDEWLGYQVERLNISGLSVAVHHHSKVAFCGAYGLADIGRQEPLTTEHVFNIGSLSKMMTATMVMQMAEEGRLSLEDKITQYLPWLTRHRDGRIHGITIGQLLSHRAGLARDGAFAPHWQLEAPFPDAKQLQRLVLGSDIFLENYSKFKYSNLGYALLGEVIETIENNAYAECAKDKIISPLKLNNTYAHYSEEASHRIATGYTRHLKGKRYPVPAEIPTRSFTAATGWYANPADVGRFMAWHFSDDAALLGKHFKQHMKSPAPGHWVASTRRGTKYGTGFMTYTMGQRKLIGHGGGFMGHVSYAFYDPQTHTSLVLLSNAKDAPLTQIAGGIFDILDHYLHYAARPATPKYMQCNARVMHLWATLAIVATNKRISAIRMHEWLPFTKADELEYVNPATLRIKKASDIAAIGEMVTLHYKNDQLQYINYAGQILRPQPLYMEWLEANLA